jgi:uncharacterized protein
MTIKRLVLFLMTAVAILVTGSSLLTSWLEPQYQSRLQLYQADIVLQALSGEVPSKNQDNLKLLQQVILGDKPLLSATTQYEEVRKEIETALEKAKDDETQITEQAIVNEQEKLLAFVDLRLGILQVQQGQKEKALKTWKTLQENPNIYPVFSNTADALIGLWSTPSRILPNTPELIKDNLDGWFRFSAFEQLYKLQQRQEELTALKTSQQAISEEALYKLTLIGVIPALGFLIGSGLLIFLVAQRFIRGKNSILAHNGEMGWSTPWNVEIILQVIIVGFFFFGQLLVPLLVQLLVRLSLIPRPAGDVKLQAVYVLITYILVASGALGIMLFSLKPFFPLESDWFSFRLQSRWLLWGIGGYCVALPVVTLVSLFNQQLWQGQGGSNPLLQLVLESRDSTALIIFFFTAAIAAPLFEEILFRGFLLPSLTRYMSVSGAIALSGFFFAVAHLSLSEILPLTSLGIILGVVYTRSRNLLAPILVHSLWNSATLLSLFIFGSGSQ